MCYYGFFSIKSFLAKWNITFTLVFVVLFCIFLPEIFMNGTKSVKFWYSFLINFHFEQNSLNFPGIAFRGFEFIWTYSPVQDQNKFKVYAKKI